MKVWDTVLDELVDSAPCKKKNCSMHHTDEGTHRYRIMIRNYSGDE